MQNFFQKLNDETYQRNIPTPTIPKNKFIIQQTEKLVTDVFESFISNFFIYLFKKEFIEELNKETMSEFEKINFALLQITKIIAYQPKWTLNFEEQNLHEPEVCQPDECANGKISNLSFKEQKIINHRKTYPTINLKCQSEKTDKIFNFFERPKTPSKVSIVKDPEFFNMQQKSLVNLGTLNPSSHTNNAIEIQIEKEESSDSDYKEQIALKLIQAKEINKKKIEVKSKTAENMNGEINLVEGRNKIGGTFNMTGQYINFRELKLKDVKSLIPNCK